MASARPNVDLCCIVHSIQCVTGVFTCANARSSAVHLRYCLGRGVIGNIGVY